MKQDNISKEKLELLKKQHRWYSYAFVLLEIIKNMSNRELAILKSKSELETKNIRVRYLYASSIKFLEQHLKVLNVSRGYNLVNLYRSINSYKPDSILTSTYNLKKRKEDPNYIQSGKNSMTNVTGFDFIIDIDGKTVMDSYSTAKLVKRLLDEYKLPYYVQNSGRRGFHFVIPSNYLPIKDYPLSTLISCLEGMSIIFGDDIDSSLLRYNGLIKVSYSFDSGNIVLPLSDEQFNNFKEEMVSMESVLSNVSLKNRGLLLRTHGLEESTLKKNVKNFIKDFSD